MPPCRLTPIGLGVLLATGVGYVWLRPQDGHRGLALQDLRLVWRQTQVALSSLPEAGFLQAMGGLSSRDVRGHGLPHRVGHSPEAGFFDSTQRPIPGQTLVRFARMKDLEDFITDATRQGLRLGSVCGPLLMVQVYGSVTDVSTLLPEGASTADNHPVRVPEVDARRLNSDQQSAPGQDLWSMIGASSRPEHLGEGVRIAILDTGLPPHADMRAGMTGAYNFVEGSTGVEDRHGHGTEVASILFGSQGLTPHALPEYYKILNDQGQGSALDMARAIVAAVDSGVAIINISSVTYADNEALKAAVAYADRHGVQIVAPAGNDARTEPAYPGAYPDVICLAGLGPDGTTSSFSNTGPHVAFALPAENVPVRGLDGTLRRGTGTSYLPPMLAVVLAETIEEQNLQPRTPLPDAPAGPYPSGFSTPTFAPVPTDAVNTLKEVSNDVEEPGRDNLSGVGVPHLDRLMSLGAYGYNDLAVATIRVPRPGEGDGTFGSVSGTSIPVQIVVQNQGNRVINDGRVQIQVGDSYRVVETLPTALGTNETATFVIELPPQYFRQAGGLNVSATVQTSGLDQKTSNDSASVNFSLGR